VWRLALVVVQRLVAVAVLQLLQSEPVCGLERITAFAAQLVRTVIPLLP
jgi:hypothetical protein